jgi:hypothetical protein
MSQLPYLSEAASTGDEFIDVWLVLLGAAIGAAGSILAGWLASRYQLIGTARVMRRIRHEERQESALLEVMRLLAPIAEQLRRMQASHRVDPDTSQPEGFRQAVGKAIDALVDRWNAELSAKALGAGIEVHVLRIQVEYLGVSSPWDKQDLSVWATAAKIEGEMRAIEARIREVLGTSRPKTRGSTEAKHAQ